MKKKLKINIEEEKGKVSGSVEVSVGMKSYLGF